MWSVLEQVACCVCRVMGMCTQMLHSMTDKYGSVHTLLLYHQQHHLIKKLRSWWQLVRIIILVAPITQIDAKFCIYDHNCYMYYMADFSLTYLVYPLLLFMLDFWLVKYLQCWIVFNSQLHMYVVETLLKLFLYVYY